MTMHDLFERYKRDVLPNLAPRTQKDYLRHLVVLDKTFGAMEPNEIQPKDVGRFLDVQKGKIQRNRQVAVLSAVFSKAVGRWYAADRNPCRDVERNDTQKRTRYVTDAEFTLVRTIMPPIVQIAMDLALLTGQRQGDLLDLRWENVRPDGVLFQPAKTKRIRGKRLLVGLSPSLEAVLDRARKLPPDLPRVYVLRTTHGSPYTSEGFRALWQRRMRKLLKGYWRKPRGKPRFWIEPKLKERFTFHDLRAKCVSDSATLDQAFERAGHTTMAMTRGVYDRGIRKVTPLR